MGCLPNLIRIRRDTRRAEVTEIINGYTLLEPLASRGGGQGEWAFAEKDGAQYFIKRFLAPTYPVDGGPGTPSSKAKKREQCANFEKHHRAIKDALAKVTGAGGNLVVTEDFFRDKARYYKTTVRVDGDALEPSLDAEQPLKVRMAIPIAVAGSIQLLHSNKIVHGDLKPSNILVTRSNPRTGKLIDFDNSFLFGSPPAPDALVGDAVYHSPELLRYINGAATPEELRGASDVFAFGLVLTKYFTGSLPVPPGIYASEAALASTGLVVEQSPAVPEVLADLLTSMLKTDPKARPGMMAVKARLAKIRDSDGQPAAPSGGGPEADDGPPDKPAAGSGRGKLTGALAPGAGSRTGDSDKPAAGMPRLRGPLAWLDDHDLLESCSPALGSIRGDADPNASARTFWSLVEAIVGRRRRDHALAAPDRLVALLPDGLRASFEALLRAPLPDAKRWAGLLLAGRDSHDHDVVVSRPVAVETEPRHATCPTPPTASPIILAASPDAGQAEPDPVHAWGVESARQAWNEALASDRLARKALAWMRLRAYVGEDDPDAGLGNQILQQWGASL